MRGFYFVCYDEYMTQVVAELLINTHSRRGREALASILETCEQENIQLTHITKLGKPDQLGYTLGVIKRRNPRLLIVGGGDGTVSDVIDHLVDSSITLGIIPLGTTNNFGRSLNIPLDPVEAVRTIKRHSAKAIDLGKVKHDYFANVTGVGLSAIIAKNVTNKQKKLFGRAAYGFVGVKELFRHKPFLVTIEDKDHELQVSFETHQVIIANGRFHAGRAIAKDADINSRELVIFTLGSGSKLSFIWHTLDFYLGRRKSIQHTSYIIARNISLRTSTPQSVELDGEVKFVTPIPIEVTPGAIKIRHAPLDM